MQREVFSSALIKRKLNIGAHTAVIVVAALISMSTVMDKPSPFSASFTAALTGIDCLGAFIGSVAGYIMTGRFSEFVTVASALLSVMAVRIFVSRLKPSSADLISSVTAACSVFTVNFLTAHSVTDISAGILLAVLSGAGAAAFSTVRRLIRHDEIAMLTLKNNPASYISAVICCATAGAVLANYTVLSFNIGIAAVCAFSMLAAARFGREVGAAAAAACSLGASLALGGYEYLAAVFTLSVLISAGVYENGGRKFTLVGVFVLVSVICLAMFGMNNDNLMLSADILMGGAVFMLLPQSFTDRSESLKAFEINESSVRRLIRRRLQFAQGAVDEVRRTVDLTADKLDSRCGKDISWVYNTACDRVCRKCRFNMMCWGKEYSDNIKQFSKITAALKNGTAIDETVFSGELGGRCPQKRELCEALSRAYESYVSFLAEKRRIAGMRSVLTAQLSATEKMLGKLSEEIEDETDTAWNKMVGDVLYGLGCEDISAVSVSAGEQGRMSVEAYSDKGFFSSKEEICEAVGLALHRRFDLPVIAAVNGSYKLSMFTKTVYFLDVEVCQISKEKNKDCGDYYDTFVDGRGSAYIILSDGMGSGNRARIDSSFACGMLVRMLQAGIGIESGLDIINMSLMVKSSDESFATLEICRVDLYSGEVEIYKAGGANTYIKCGGKYSRYGCKGLPVGVKDTLVYEKKTFTLGNRDMIIMTSDGAELNEKWLYREMARCDDDLNAFAKQIADTARFYSGDKKADDITVIAMRLCR